MTPKSKAIELINKFKLHVLIDEIEETPIFYDQKQCAKIVVQEIINDNPNIYDSDRLNYKYWNEVLKEIDNVESSAL